MADEKKVPTTPVSTSSDADDQPAKKQKFRWRNFWICFFIAFGQIAFGYPASIIATTLGQPAFVTYMGLVNADGAMGANANDLIGATSGVFQVRCSLGLDEESVGVRKTRS